MEELTEASNLEQVIDRNVERMKKVRAKKAQEMKPHDRFAATVARFTGSMTFVIVQAFFVTLWLLINTDVLPIMPKFDPYPFVMLAVFCSVETIFLSTFVLINQNRQGELADHRDDLHLHMSLLTEHELTRLIRIANSMALRMGIDIKEEIGDVEQIQRDIRPEQVVARMDKDDSLS